MINYDLLDKLIEENKINQSFQLEEILKELFEKWESEKYYFDKNEATKIYKYIKLLRNDKGTARHFNILRFQFEIIVEVLCVKRKKDNIRRFREAHINVARKNSKSFLVGIIMSYLFFFQKDIFGALFIITGNTTKQATELYNTFKCFVKGNKALLRRCKITDSRKEIIRKDNNNKLIVLSNDGGGADSYADYCFACDEIHEYSSDEIYGKLKTGQGVWDDPLAITLTTASSGENPNNLEMQLYEASKTMENSKTPEDLKDETFYFRIYEADKDCKIDDVTQWFKANPALGFFRKVDDIVNLCKRVALMPLQENMFRRMFLNQHVATDHIKNAINMELWNDCVDDDIKLGDFKGMKCWCGLDLSSQHDVTGFVQIFYDDDTDKFYVFPHLFTAKDTIVEREEKDKNPYSTWVSNKELITTEGRYIKFNDMLDHITNLSKDYPIEKLGYDRFGSPTIMNVLENEWDIVPLGQGTVTMTTFINAFENLLIDNRIIIAKNSLFDFMASNCVAVYNEQLDCKYSKKKSKFKIDGIIAMLMGLGLAIEDNDVEHYNAIEALESMDWD
ncbi:terminase large subunit [Clostridium botulinum]|uniref:terminase large subunit n=1 Tax=Clostridium botulinum TaxID=1491 RepID=UPI001401B2FD|nr:terminase TerL endonuclease subunit [Clostridium botulinum]MBY6835983.1 terminase large subunit [Clostridium botulinum]MBY6929798.1 terminase large subunit [Clostridium botulinum]NFG65767.1 terminase large subunit [Clostridium botulinum]NFQ22603.1 terminase large subunit [Clostridium botulinum]